ncbi:MAG: glycerol-3-phosphate dehydrogenase/oxidase [Pseudomonadales bacterium]|nr:glycerol-3-phosphate dehydrogenase/oxidase [Pseudomonadales bacterium]
MNVSHSRNIAAFESIEFDLAIVGGGITGAGIARHAAKCGLKVALLEANDFASGTSSKSSKLIHGGLRYLAMGDIGLVRETALERKKVHQMAPHLAEPAWMLFPLKSQLSLLKFRVGIGIYERLGAVRAKDRHKNFSRRELVEFEPCLDSDTFALGCAYREYVTDDARLVLAVLRAAQSDGAMTLNYAEVTGLDLQDQQIGGLRVRCKISGRDLRIKSKVVVNATGPWVEKSIKNWENYPAKVKLHLSKGVHIAVPHECLPLSSILVMDTHDGRSIFAIPRGDITYIGTTDTSYDGPPTLWPRVLAEDVDYLLDVLPDFFPKAKIQKRHIVAAWAGLRPLVHQPGKSSRELSRKDEIWVSDTTGLISMAGGKLTGFRKMAEEALVVVGKSLGYDLACKDPLSLLPGGDIESVDQEVAKLKSIYGLTDKNALRMVRLYGGEASQVIVLGRQPVAESSCIFVGEIDWAITRESALTLEDVVYRRLRIVWYEPQELDLVLEPIALLMSRYLGWSDAERCQELVAVRKQMADERRFMSE